MERIGQFRILELLGQGGMGVVYKALDERLGRVVALKVLPASGSDQEERRLRFLREARSAARVTHPAIVGIYEVGAADGRLFIAMELVEGESLRQRLGHGPLPVAEAIRIALEVASALAKAHASGIIHRDLKPDNVMLTKDGNAKVLDFGIARFGTDTPESGDPALANTEAQITREGQLLGTPGYMSPEQAVGGEVDARSDLFSFGVMLYELLGGRLPWPAATPMELVLAAARDAPRPLSELTTSVPAPIVELVNQCLERDRERRCASAEQIVERLTLARELIERGEAKTDLALSSRVAAPAKSSHRKLALAAIVGLAALLGLGSALSSRHSAPVTGPSSSVAPELFTLATLPIEGCNEAATLEVKKGLAMWRQAAWHKSAKHFERATQDDPECATAFLRLAVVDDAAPGSVIRSRFQRAAELRHKLGPRDSDMLDAYEPTLGRDPPVPSERKQRFLKLAEAHPNDAEFVAVGGWLLRNDDPARAEKMIERSLEIDPGYSDAWQVLARVRQMRGNSAGARDALDRCISGSPVTTDCVYERITIARAAGAECSALEPDARLWLARDAQNPHGQYYLGLILAGQGEREAAARALGLRWSSLPADRSGVVEQREAAQIAFFFGDFAEGKKRLSELDVRARARNEFPERAHHAILAIDFAVEMRATRDARRLAETIARELPVWSRTTEEFSPRVGFWFEPWLLATRIELGAIPGPTGRELDRWRALDDTLTRSPLARWALGEALPAVTSVEAERVLGTMPPGAKPDAGEHSFLQNYAIGKTLLLADRPREAQPFLQTALGRCDGFELPFLRARARLLLGQALEKNRDVPHACIEYRKVLERWGETKPLPVTAAAARKRVTALFCEP